MLVIVVDDAVGSEKADGCGHVQGMVRSGVVVGVYPAVDRFLGRRQRLERHHVIEELRALSAMKRSILPVVVGERGGLVRRWLMPFSRQMRSKSTSTGCGRV